MPARAAVGTLTPWIRPTKKKAAGTTVEPRCYHGNEPHTEKESGKTNNPARTRCRMQARSRIRGHASARCFWHNLRSGFAQQRKSPGRPSSPDVTTATSHTQRKKRVKRTTQHGCVVGCMLDRASAGVPARAPFGTLTDCIRPTKKAAGKTVESRCYHGNKPHTEEESGETNNPKRTRRRRQARSRIRGRASERCVRHTHALHSPTKESRRDDRQTAMLPRQQARQRE
jgi:hypothetical protein